MSLLRWAILIELFGFALASVSLLLRIGIIKAFADKCKTKIDELHKFLKNFTVTQNIRDISATLDSGVATRRRGMILRPIMAFLIDFPRYTFWLIVIKIKLSNIDRIKKKRPDHMFTNEEKIRKYFDEMKRLFLKRVKIMSLTILVLWPIIFIVLPLLKSLIKFFNVIEWVTAKLTEANMITNITIGFGTLAIIIGLVLEFWGMR